MENEKQFYGNKKWKHGKVLLCILRSSIPFHQLIRQLIQQLFYKYIFGPTNGDFTILLK